MICKRATDMLKSESRCPLTHQRPKRAGLGDFLVTELRATEGPEECWFYRDRIKIWITFYILDVFWCLCIFLNQGKPHVRLLHRWLALVTSLHAGVLPNAVQAWLGLCRFSKNGFHIHYSPLESVSIVCCFSFWSESVSFTFSRLTLLYKSAELGTAFIKKEYSHGKGSGMRHFFLTTKAERSVSWCDCRSENNFSASLCFQHQATIYTLGIVCIRTACRFHVLIYCSPLYEPSDGSNW